MKNLRSTLVFSGLILSGSVIYYFYLLNVHPPGAERETLLSEIGEFFGEVALWTMGIIYARTGLKMLVGRGGPMQRLVPEFAVASTESLIRKILVWLNRTHVQVGVATIAVLFLHVAMVGLPLDILFFPGVIALLVWQTLFGFFIRIKASPRELKKFSFYVHSQLITGIAIGIFAYFGHLLVDA